MRTIGVFAGLFIAEAGTLAVTWEDCGAQHAIVKDLQPSTLETGTTTTLIGSGTTDEEITSAQFSTTIKAKGVKIASCSGDATEDITCKLPLGAGQITVKAVSYPLAKGDVSIVTEIQTSSLIPAQLDSVTAEIRASEQNGEDVICLNVHTDKAAMQAVANLGEVFDALGLERVFSGNGSTPEETEETMLTLIGFAKGLATEEAASECQADATYVVEKFASAAKALQVPSLNATTDLSDAFGEIKPMVGDCQRAVEEAQALIKGLQYMDIPGNLKAQRTLILKAEAAASECYDEKDYDCFGMYLGIALRHVLVKEEKAILV